MDTTKDVRTTKRPKRPSAFSAFFDWVDARHIIHRGELLFVLWLTYIALQWAMSYAEKVATSNGTSVAAVIGAIMAPITALQGWVFKTYSERRNNTSTQGTKDDSDTN